MVVPLVKPDGCTESRRLLYPQKMPDKKGGIGTHFIGLFACIEQLSGCITVSKMLRPGTNFAFTKKDSFQVVGCQL
jgi:hypothetical protein